MSKLWQNFLLLFLMVFSFSGCIVVENPHTGLAPGTWRAVLKLEPRPVAPNPKGEPLPEKVGLQFEEVTDGQLPFTFEVIYSSETDFYIEIINGSERIQLKDITIGRDRATAKDTIIINFPVYQSYLKGIYENNILEGEWVVTNRQNYSIPFVARHGQGHRFTTLKKEPKMDISGKWEANFEIDTETPFKAIGEFEQDNNYLTGTFMTETGDYRFLEGTVQDDKVYLSCFDGAHAFLFEAKIQDDSTLLGSFRSGKHYQTLWEARKNPNFQLTDPDSLTFLKEGYDKVAFTFENTEGQMVSLEDPPYQNKIKIVQIFGTWCPNCRDETEYLVEYLKNNPHPDLEVIGLAFEKFREKDKALQTLQTYKEQLNIDYELLLAGYYNKSEAEALPMLNDILSYPTLIFIDRNDQVRKIHTGFSGPATSQYTDFKKEFETFVKKLLKE